MFWFWWIYGGLIAVITLVIVADLAVGIRSVPDLTRPQWDAWPEGKHPRVSVIVPARNEGEGIGACLGSLAAQDYDNLEIIAVNDRSTDGTGAIMRQMTSMAPNLRVLTISELPAGWLGKTHAMWTAAKVATGEWLLFTDGDIMLREDTVRRAVTFVESAGADHLVILPTFVTRKVVERMMIAMFDHRHADGLHRSDGFVGAAADHVEGTGAAGGARFRIRKLPQACAADGRDVDLHPPTPGSASAHPGQGGGVAVFPVV